MKNKHWTSVIAIIAFSGLGGCGGGGGGGGSLPPAPPATLISGVVATGSPLVGFVAIKDVNGQVATADIDAGGNYSVDTNALTLPLVLYASGVSGGHAYSIVSAATSKDVGNTVNITPLTDLIVANAAGKNSTDFFKSPNYALLNANNLQASKDVLTQRLQPILNAAGIPNTFDIMNSAFATDNTGYDGLLDLLDVQVNTTTNQATVTYLLDPAVTITDDLTSSADTTPIPLGTVTSGTITADSTVIQSLSAFLNNFRDLIFAGVPTSAQVTPFFKANFLLEGLTRPMVVSLFTSALPVDVSDAKRTVSNFENFSIVSLQTTYPQVAQIRASDGKLMNLEKVNATSAWQLTGDNTQWGLEAAPESHLNQASNTVVNTFSVNIFDDNNQITPNNYFVITGPGLDTYGAVVVQYDFNDFNNAAGKNTLMYKIIVDDYTALNYPDGSDYTLKRYNDVNVNTNIRAGVGQVNVHKASTLTGTVDDVLVDTNIVRLMKRPIKPSETTSYITITNPTATAFSGFTAGLLNATWSLPVGSKSSLVSVLEQDLTTFASAWLVEVEVAQNATSKSLTVPAPTVVNRKPSLYVFGYDVFNRVTATHINSF